MPKLPRGLAPKRPRNLFLTLGVVLVLLLSYTIAAAGGGFSPKRGMGLVFGILAALLFVFEMSYPVRRPRARPLGRAMAWAQAHVYLGVVAMVAVLLHADLGLPHGGMGWWLLLLSLWTTLTGLAGVALQKWIPAALAQGLRVEALYERIPALVEKLVAQADALMEGASDTLGSFYERDVRPALGTLNTSPAFLFDVRAGRDRALAPLVRMSQFVAAEEKERLDDLMSLYTEKMELDAQRSLQGLLRRWLLLHAPPAGLLLALLLVHVATWIWY